MHGFGTFNTLVLGHLILRQLIALKAVVNKAYKLSRSQLQCKAIQYSIFYCYEPMFTILVVSQP